MEYRILGRTGLKVSVFGIGSWQLSGALTIDGLPDGFPDCGTQKAIAIIKGCQDLGINLIDTAEIYGDGEGERRIGAAIAGQRDRWIISDKFGLRTNSQQQRITNPDPDTIRTSLEGSLRRLNTDYIDIYLYHVPPQPELLEAGREVLETLKNQGKIRFYGISTDHPKELKRLVQHNAVEVVNCAQSLLVRPQAILNLVQKNNLGMISRGSLLGGQLSGKYFHQPPQLSPQDFRYQRPINWGKYQHYASLIPEGGTMVGMSLRYLLDSPLTQTILVGGKSLQDYHEALTALKMQPLDAKTRSQIDRRRAQENLLLPVKKVWRPFKKMLFQA